MKKILTAASLGLMLSACGQTVNSDSTTKESNDTQNEEMTLSAPTSGYTAEHCEVFVDKVKISGFGAYGNHDMVYFVKILPDRLDGEVAKVGAFVKEEGTIHGQPHEKDWHEKEAELVGGNDYYKVSFTGPNNLVRVFVEGNFFVETTKGTRYWLNPVGDSTISKDGNFKLSGIQILDATRNACKAQGGSFSSCFAAEANTLSFGQDLSLMNPKGCK